MFSILLLKKCISLDPIDDSVMVDDVNADDHTSSSASENEDLLFYHYSKVATICSSTLIIVSYMSKLSRQKLS